MKYDSVYRVNRRIAEQGLLQLIRATIYLVSNRACYLTAIAVRMRSCIMTTAHGNPVRNTQNVLHSSITHRCKRSVHRGRSRLEPIPYSVSWNLVHQCDDADSGMSESKNTSPPRSWGRYFWILSLKAFCGGTPLLFPCVFETWLEPSFTAWPHRGSQRGRPSRQHREHLRRNP